MGSGNSAPTMTDLRRARNDELLVTALNRSKDFKRGISCPGVTFEEGENAAASPKSGVKMRQVSEGAYPNRQTSGDNAAASTSSRRGSKLRPNSQSTASGEGTPQSSRQGSKSRTSSENNTRLVRTERETTNLQSRSEPKKGSGSFPMFSRLIGAACPRQRRTQVEEFREEFTGVSPQPSPPSPCFPLLDVEGASKDAEFAKRRAHLKAARQLWSSLAVDWGSTTDLADGSVPMDPMPSQGSAAVLSLECLSKRESESARSITSRHGSESARSSVPSTSDCHVNQPSSVPSADDVPSPQAQQVIGALAYRCTQLELECHRLRAAASDAAKGSQCSSPAKRASSSGSSEQCSDQAKQDQAEPSPWWAAQNLGQSSQLCTSPANHQASSSASTSYEPSSDQAEPSSSCSSTKLGQTSPLMNSWKLNETGAERRLRIARSKYEEC